LVPSQKIRRGNRKGFTLVELLVAMVLVSMVTLVVAMALRISIESWEHGVEEGENIQVRVAVPALMGKQLNSLVRTDPFDEAAKKRLLPFCGQAHALSFFTSYAPQGSPWQGLLKITYLFKEKEKTLCLYEQVITREEDLNAAFDPMTGKMDESSRPISQVPGISGFDLTYTDQEKHDPQEKDSWKESWECSSTSLPTGLEVRLQVGTGSKMQSRSWYFRLTGIEP